VKRAVRRALRARGIAAFAAFLDEFWFLLLGHRPT
jgi:hypothetical protein